MKQTENIVSVSLSSCLKECLKLAQNQKLKVVSDTLQQVLDNLDSPMQLAIIGKISSSKSTMVNAILGNDDIVEMGHKETTYNVSWLKYGSSEADVKVVFKDGRYEFVPRNKWKEWSGQSENKLKDTVKYIEVTYDDEMLKDVNIIDTPGLDSAKGIDSKNTIDFLKDVRPDALMMVFTHGLAKSTMDVVKEFQGKYANKMLLSPLNAIGVLSKIDKLWSFNKKVQPMEHAQKEIIEGNIYHLFPEVRESLYGIIPLCAKLGLASQTLTQHDIDFLKVLSKTEEGTLAKMFMDADLFKKGSFNVGISFDDREYLEEKFGRYGVWELLGFMQRGDDDVKSIKKHLREISGFDNLCKCLYSHFGQRSYLIKTQSIHHVIAQACNKQRKDAKTDAEKQMVDSIQEQILVTMMGIFEYEQLDYLSKLYEGTMNIKDQQAVEEYKRVCGEYGNSVVRRMNMSKDESIDAMCDEAKKRAQLASKKATMMRMSKPHDSDLYRMISRSYSHLAQRIDEMRVKKDDAEKIIKITNEFFYGE